MHQLVGERRLRRKMCRLVTPIGDVTVISQTSFLALSAQKEKKNIEIDRTLGPSIFSVARGHSLHDEQYD